MKIAGAVRWVASWLLLVSLSPRPVDTLASIASGLKEAVPGQGQQAQHVPADAARQKTQALARAVSALANAHVIQRAQAEFVERKSAAADGAGNFVKGVKRRAAAVEDAKYTDAVLA